QEATIVDGFTVNNTATGIGDTPFAAKNELMQNHPNPFNPTTTIQYAIKAAGPVSIKIYNAAGQQVRTLVNEFQTPRAQGYSVIWRGRNDMGEPVASGVYLYRLTAVGFTDVKKLVLLK
ncbi:MAG: T9SS type A sorting domain-containing protein, partial [bacterium]|nr:T9SS type A sorting domain-containing protein [bacterium]